MDDKQHFEHAVKQGPALDMRPRLAEELELELVRAGTDNAEAFMIPWSIGWEQLNGSLAFFSYMVFIATAGHFGTLGRINAFLLLFFVSVLVWRWKPSDTCMS